MKDLICCLIMKGCHEYIYFINFAPVYSLPNIVLTSSNVPAVPGVSITTYIFMSRGMAVTVSVDGFRDDFVCGGLATTGEGFDTDDGGKEK